MDHFSDTCICTAAEFDSLPAVAATRETRLGDPRAVLLVPGDPPSY